MVRYTTDKGPVTVDRQSEDFYLCTHETAGGYSRELYVAALFPKEAVKKAIRFWYGRDPKFINN